MFTALPFPFSLPLCISPMNSALFLGLTPHSPPFTPPHDYGRRPSSSTIHFSFNSLNNYNFPYFPLKSHQNPTRSNLRKKFLFLVSAADDNSNSNGDDSNDPLSKSVNKQREIGENGLNNNTNDNSGGRGENGNGKGNENGNGLPRLNLKWVDLLLDPDPDNVVAVGLTGVLAWASVQVLWQLFVISIAILLAALKYSFVAALLIFILITLL